MAVQKFCGVVESEYLAGTEPVTGARMPPAQRGCSSSCPSRAGIPIGSKQPERGPFVQAAERPYAGLPASVDQQNFAFRTSDHR